MNLGTDQNWTTTYSWKHKHCTANFTYRVNYHYHKIHLLHECRYKKVSQCLYVLFWSTFKFYTTYIHTFLIIVKSTISIVEQVLLAFQQPRIESLFSRWSWLRKIRRPDGPSDWSSGDHTNRWTEMDGPLGQVGKLIGSEVVQVSAQKNKICFRTLCGVLLVSLVTCDEIFLHFCNPQKE